MEAAALDCLTNQDDALRYVTCLLFDRLYSMILNCNLCSDGKEWSELLQHVLKRGQLPQVFQNLSDFVVAVFKVTRP